MWIDSSSMTRWDGNCLAGSVRAAATRGPRARSSGARKQRLFGAPVGRVNRGHEEEAPDRVEFTI
jgi:hypothetical protein